MDSYVWCTRMTNTLIDSACRSTQDIPKIVEYKNIFWISIKSHCQGTTNIQNQLLMLVLSENFISQKNLNTWSSLFPILKKTYLWINVSELFFICNSISGANCLTEAKSHVDRHSKVRYRSISILELNLCACVYVWTNTVLWSFILNPGRYKEKKISSRSPTPFQAL